MPSTATVPDVPVRRFARSVRAGRWLFGVAVCCLVLAAVGLGVASASADAPAGRPNTPQAALTEFYQWYVGALARDRIPVRDDRAKMELYVTRPLLQAIARRMNGPEGLDQDYFTQAQDSFDDWASHVSISEVRIDGTTAAAVVTLGAGSESRHRVAVRLVSEGGRWKISRVADPGSRPSGVHERAPE